VETLLEFMLQIAMFVILIGAQTREMVYAKLPVAQFKHVMNNQILAVVLDAQHHHLPQQQLLYQ
jgi:hypothetical protein